MDCNGPLENPFLFLQRPECSHVRYREGYAVLRVVASADVESPVFHADSTAIGVVGHLRGRVRQYGAFVIVVCAEGRVPALAVAVTDSESPAKLVRTGRNQRVRTHL